MSKSKPSRPSPSAIPILMRLPDLRPKAGSRGADAPKTEPDPPRAAEQQAPEAPPAEPADNAAEVQLQAAAQVEQSEQAAASSTAIAAPVVSVPTAVEAAPVVEMATANEPAQSVAATAETTAASTEKEPASEKERPSETEKAPEVAASQADVTNASPADSADPVTPAAARRQRALERQRRQAAEPPRQRSWWTTHLPIIAIGFVLALILTIYAGRRNRVQSTDESRAAVEVPELEIYPGDGSESLSPASSAQGVLAVDKSDEALPAESDVSPKAKSPPLLSAKPKLTENEPPLDQGSPAPSEPVPTTPSEPIRTAASASNNGNEITNHFVTSPGESSAPAAAELTADAAVSYPSTEPAVYRPGGRAPREARVPNYPETSTPNLR